MTPVPRGIDAVEEVDAPLHALEDVDRGPDAHQVGGLILRQIGDGLVQDVVHLLVGLADGKAAHGVPVEVELRDPLGVVDADLRVDGALVDAKEELVGIHRILLLLVLVHRLLAAKEPAGGPLDGGLHIGLLRKGRRALVKGHGDGGSQVRLDPHALLRAHEDLSAVDVAVEGDALLLDVSKFRQGEDLKAAGVREDRVLPERKLVQAAEGLDCLVPGAHVQVVGVAEHHLGVDGLQVVLGEAPLDRAAGRDVHKDRGLNGAVDGLKRCPLGPSLDGFDGVGAVFFAHIVLSRCR